MTPSSLPSRPEHEKKSSLPSRGAVPHLPDGVTVGEEKFPNEHFPGTQLDLDLLSACARIRQVHNEGPDTCGGIIFDRLFTCDLPRLLGHVSRDAKTWAADVANLDG